MKKVFPLVFMVSLLWVPATMYAQPNQAVNAPPVSQPLVREGDFAVKLVDGLKMGTAKDEAEAESMLASVGVAPKNGWIADYPTTPDIIGELESATAEAADSGRLQMARDEAVKAFQKVAFDAGLPITLDTSGTSGQYAEAPPPTSPQYTDPEVVNDYYYSEGPPVVTYYPPPWDYAYMYAWVPSPFFFSSFFFPGFFILHDFDKVIVVNRRPCVVTNHFFDRDHRRFFVIDHLRRGTGKGFITAGDRFRGRWFNSNEGRRGAASIFERSRERAGTERGRIERSRSGFARGARGFREERTPVFRGRDRGPAASFERSSAGFPKRTERGSAVGRMPERFNSPRLRRNVDRERTPAFRGRNSGFGRSFERGSAAFNSMPERSGRGFGAVPFRGGGGSGRGSSRTFHGGAFGRGGSRGG
jgi:hypothetical protein